MWLSVYKYFFEQNSVISEVQLEINPYNIIFQLSTASHNVFTYLTVNDKVHKSGKVIIMVIVYTLECATHHFPYPFPN